MKAVLITIVLLAVAGGLIWFFGFRETVEPEPVQSTQTSTLTDDTNSESSEEASVAQTITYTDSGFAPSKVTIKVGDTVRFVNNSSRTIRVASDEHPEHDLYPEFDDTSGTAKGGSYEFTFTKAGTWGFHNHNQPTHVGTVTVED